jgi:hypothetical protein
LLAFLKRRNPDAADMADDDDRDRCAPGGD